MPTLFTRMSSPPSADTAPETASSAPSAVARSAGTPTIPSIPTSGCREATATAAPSACEQLRGLQANAATAAGDEGSHTGRVPGPCRRMLLGRMIPGHDSTVARPPRRDRLEPRGPLAGSRRATAERRGPCPGRRPGVSGSSALDPDGALLERSAAGVGDRRRGAAAACGLTPARRPGCARSTSAIGPGSPAPRSRSVIQSGIAPTCRTLAPGIPAVRRSRRSNDDRWPPSTRICAEHADGDGDRRDLSRRHHSRAGIRGARTRHAPGRMLAPGPDQRLAVADGLGCRHAAGDVVQRHRPPRPRPT